MFWKSVAAVDLAVPRTQLEFSKPFRLVLAVNKAMLETE
jgi:hypothetical protein